MVTTVTVSCDPELTWQHKALAELEDSIGQPLDLWTFCKTKGWQPQVTSAELSGQDLSEESIEIAINRWSALLDRAILEREPLANELLPGQYLFVIPLDHRTAATTTVQTNTPDLLVSLANIAYSYFRQQEKLTQLREENDFFLKQVSDDFEELTFLRSMAERLGLGDSTNSVEDLVSSSLADLGKSAHAEELHFVLNVEGQMQIVASWRADEIEWSDQGKDSIEQLIRHYQGTAQLQPAIKNGFDTTAQGRAYPGVRDYIIVPIGEDGSVIGWFVALNRMHEGGESREFPEWRLNQHEFGTSEASLLSTAAAMTSSHANNLSLFQQHEQLLVNVVRTLVFAIEAKDEYTRGHSERVALYAKRLAQQLGYDEESCELLYMTGLLHDIGKIAINDAILNKPDQLTDEEFAEIQQHPDEGWKILQELQQLSYVLPGVLYHHERMDGKGYPDGLQGKKIPLDGRVLAVADAYDAMTSDRAYRTGMPHDKAMSILQEGAGTQWDAKAIEAFLDIETEITEIRQNYQPHEIPNRKPSPAGSFLQ